MTVYSYKKADPKAPELGATIYENGKAIFKTAHKKGMGGEIMMTLRNTSARLSSSLAVAATWTSRRTMQALTMTGFPMKSRRSSRPRNFPALLTA